MQLGGLFEEDPIPRMPVTSDRQPHRPKRVTDVFPMLAFVARPVSNKEIKTNKKALEALLKSARVTPGSFQVDSTPEYTFISAIQNSNPKMTLLNPETLDAAQNALLDAQVDVALPLPNQDPAHLEIKAGATPLGQVLKTLSQQLGTPVAAEPGLEELPVNPCAFNHVRVRTAVDLLIRQWPVAEFGYELTGGQILIERRK